MIAADIIKLWLKLRALRRRQSREGNTVMSKTPQEAVAAGARAIWERSECEVTFDEALKLSKPLVEWAFNDAKVCIEAADAARAQGADITDEIVEKALSAYYSVSVWLQNMNGGANDSFRTSMREALKAVRSDMVALAGGEA